MVRYEGDFMPPVTPFLWFDTEAEEAAKFYVSIFPNSKITGVTRYPKGSPRPEGSVMTVNFELDGQRFTALNAGPQFQFTEAISFVIECQTQEEVDRYWSKLTADGQEVECGWLKDRYGLFWQVTPRILLEMIGDPDPAKAERVMKAMLQMKKIEIAPLKQ